MIVGIDLGTTNSAVAFLDRGVPRVIPDRLGNTLLPSVVWASDNGIIVGQEARSNLVAQWDKSVYSVKRFMGKRLSDLGDQRFPFPLQDHQGTLKIGIGETFYTPPEISAMILKELRARAEVYLKEPVKQAVITVPAYFNHAEREATKDAGRIAGLEVLRIVNEPTAAALAYGLQKKKEGRLAIYDFGGGTFDVSILTVQNGIFEVLATNGDTHLGGDDIDCRFMEWIADDIATQGIDLRADRKAMQEIRLLAEEAKCALSEQMSYELVFSSSRHKVEYRRLVHRSEFEALIQDILSRTLLPCQRALSDARLAPNNLDDVILVGGSTRIPKVQKAVADFFGKPAHCTLNPEEVVALGAAIQADILAGRSEETCNYLLLDVTPLSLGIETVGGLVSRLIQRNTTIPISASDLFTTSVDGQTVISIHVVQGEREKVADCRSLARFDLSGIDPMPAGVPRLKVTFMIDANGILNVEAVEERTGKKQSVRVHPSYGLTEDRVDAAVCASQQNQEADNEARRLIEARNNAEALIRHVQKGLNTGCALIDSAERQKIEQAMADLGAAQKGTDCARLYEATCHLEQVTKHLAEVVMSTVLSQALAQETKGE